MTNITRRHAIKLLAAMGALSFGTTFVGCSDNKEEKVLSSTGSVKAERQYQRAIATNAALATEVGKNILEQGGNAVDAAVAVGFALGVVQPYGSGLGGGGGMLIYDTASGKSDFIDYRVAAPHSFSAKQGSTCIPGFVKGAELAHSLYGSMEWGRVVQPSRSLAEDGFTIDSSLASYLSQYQGNLQGIEGFWDNGEILKRGDTLKQPQLASALSAISDKGSVGFYEGDVADSVSGSMGCLPSDLTEYEAHRRDCLVQQCLGIDFCVAPAPFSGATVLTLLKCMGILGSPSPSSSPQEYLDALSRSSSLANTVRAKYLSDPEFAEAVDYGAILSDENLSKLLNSGLNVGAGTSEPESDTTTSYSIMDDSGLLVVATNTLGEFFGSGTHCNGFFLNNGMDSFSTEGVNAYQPGKRPRTYTAPLVVNGGSFVFGAGSPGGTRIPKIMSQVLYSVLNEGMSLQGAVDANRVLYLDNSAFAVESEKGREDILDFSATSGYRAVKGTTKTYFGAVEIAGFDASLGGIAVNDTRRSGSAEVF